MKTIHKDENFYVKQQGEDNREEFVEMKEQDQAERDEQDYYPAEGYSDVY